MNTTQAKTALNEAIDDLKQARDQARLRLHLSSMEAKQRWNKLEASVEESIRRGRDEATEMAVTKARELAKSVREFTQSNSSSKTSSN